MIRKKGIKSTDYIDTGRIDPVTGAVKEFSCTDHARTLVEL